MAILAGWVSTPQVTPQFPFQNAQDVEQLPWATRGRGWRGLVVHRKQRGPRGGSGATDVRGRSGLVRFSDDDLHVGAGAPFVTKPSRRGEV